MVRYALALAMATLLLPGAVLGANGLGPHSHAASVVSTPSGSGALAAVAGATIRQGMSDSIETGSIACNGGSPGFLHTENSYYRAFTLATFPALNLDQFRVDSVAFGIQTVNDAAGAGQPITVRLHTTSANPPTLASLTLLTSESVTVPDSASGTLFNVNLANPPVLDVATDTLVVEVLVPEGQTAGHSFFIGSNSTEQAGASFIRAPDCGLADIGNLAAIGFANMHIVMTVSGNTQVPVTLESFDVE